MFPQLVIPSQDVKLMINGPWGIPFYLNSVASFNYEDAQNTQDVYAISHKKPIAVVSVNTTYSGSMDLQSGEAGLLLDAINAKQPSGQLYASLLDIPYFTVTMTRQYKNTGTPMSEIITWENCVLDRNSGSVTANDAQTMTSISFRGTGISRKVTLLPL